MGTFNVGGEDPGYESLEEWLDTKRKRIEPADVSWLFCTNNLHFEII